MCDAYWNNIITLQKLLCNINFCSCLHREMHSKPVELVWLEPCTCAVTRTRTRMGKMGTNDFSVSLRQWWLGVQRFAYLGFPHQVNWKLLHVSCPGLVGHGAVKKVRNRTNAYNQGTDMYPKQFSSYLQWMFGVFGIIQVQIDSSWRGKYRVQVAHMQMKHDGMYYMTLLT